MLLYADHEKPHRALFLERADAERAVTHFERAIIRPLVFGD